MKGQSGVDFVFTFLSMPSSPRETAMGGSLISVWDDDVSLAFSNPSLLNPKMDNRIFFSHNFLVADISSGYFSYGKHVENWSLTLHGGIKYIDYGNFDLTDIFGNIEGEFSANELALFAGAGHQLNDRLSLGLNVKYIVSQLAGFNSGGMAMDLGMVYVNEEEDMSFAVTLVNAGTEIYSHRDFLSLTPVDLRIGFTRRLNKIPFRFSVIAHQMLKWNLRQESPLDLRTDFFGNVIEKSALSIAAENFFRHFIFNGEFLLGAKENFRLRFGYNHLRRRELSVGEFRNLSGFSLGFGLKAKGFRLDYGVGYFHLGGNSNHVGISVDLNSFTKNRL